MEKNTAVTDFKPFKKYFSRIGFSCSWLVLITLIVQGLGIALIRWRSPQLLNTSWFLWLLSLIPLYVFAFPVYLLTLPRPLDKPMPKGKISVKEFFMFLLMSFGIMYPLNILGNLVTLALQGVFRVRAVNPLAEIMSMSNPFIALLFAVIIAPVMEELIFRKLLIDRIGRIDKRSALFFSALAFGLFHGNFYQFFYAYGLGLLFGFIYIKTGRLHYTIGLHMVINFFGTSASILSAKFLNSNTLMSRGTDRAEMLNKLLASLPYLLVMLLVGLIVMTLVGVGIYLLIRERKRFRVAEPDDAIPDERAFSIVYMTWGVGLFALICIVEFVLNLL